MLANAFNKLILSLMTATLGGSLAHAAEPPASIQLLESKRAGSACKAGSASVTLTDSKDALVIDDLEIVVKTGKEAKLRERRQNCNYIVQIKLPMGWRFNVTEFEAPYEATLTGKQTAEVNFSIRMQQGPNKDEKKATATITKAEQKVLMKVDNLPSACGPTTVTLLPDISAKLITAGDTTNATFSLKGPAKLSLAWSKCGY